MKLVPARPEDAAACARILNDWIDATPWMPRVHPHDDVERHYREDVLPNRKVTLARTENGEVHGFIAVDPGDAFVTALYLSATGQGIGKRLLDHARNGRDELFLWTFQANTGARHFYAREGFAEIRRTAGDNEEGLPDILMRWRRGD